MVNRHALAPAPLPEGQLPPSQDTLAARLLAVTLLLVFLSALLVYCLLLASYRENYLERRLSNAYLVTLAFQEGGQLPDKPLESNLLERATVTGLEVWLRGDGQLLILGNVMVADAYLEIPSADFLTRLREALITLRYRGQRLLSVTGRPAVGQGTPVTVFLDERELYLELMAYSRDILGFTVFIAVASALLVYLSLQWFLVRAIRRITRNLVQFRRDPEAPGQVIQPSRRRDEIGVMERELARMQHELQRALAQQSRLAALGIAVSKINHDLKSVLSTVSIASSQLAQVASPAVAKILPLISESVERAVQLCAQTQDLARGDEPVPNRGQFSLCQLINALQHELRVRSSIAVEIQVEVAEGLWIHADYERLYRGLANLCRNALEALAGEGLIRIAAWAEGNDLIIDLKDSGPGLPERVRSNLFKPFVSSKTGGTGLGLITARDLARAHGGDLVLVASGPQGSHFQMILPGAVVQAN